ncbi:diaminobutyrate acetyltransferase [Thiomicrorhabdus aquaedulcis]|uniref:diaminobutyrate acetyltransferase n=1 Tax=Thiomicrorhabdus aquaedulcis TaxID=2211106 RepID=UPI000FD73AC1|nr:diaminobutyrate acetyltransferase [Thiomicrorhabdus aquaedulcis]
MTHNTHPQIHFRPPVLNDGAAIYQLIQSCTPLDLNSHYLYLLQASHFADTCMVALKNKQVVGFVSAYIQPNNPTTLFVWQVAVAQSMRGQGLAKALLNALLQQLFCTAPLGVSNTTNATNRFAGITQLTCTISDSNKASQGLFAWLAHAHNLHLTTEPFIERSHFGEHTHEAETLYILSSPTHQPLVTSLLGNFS